MNLLLLLLACSSTEVPAPATTPVEPPRITRTTFNALAAELALPVFQRADGTLVEVRSPLPFDGDLAAAATAIAERHAAGPGDSELSPDEQARRRGVRRELAAGRPTLLETDLRSLPEAERVLAGHLLDAAAAVEHLYALQNGSAPLWESQPPADPESRSLWVRNQGPWCVLPDSGEACGALASMPPQRAGIYPAQLQVDGFCDGLPAAALDPFVAMTDPETVVPYTERWPEEMAAAATALRAAADAAPEDEAALAVYLRAAADAFASNDWFAADAAWAAMNQQNSAWYVRVGPDETYWDPCNTHAGFHMTLARIDPAGLEAQALLEPVKQDLEEALATLAGPPYAARTVGFDLPEFIEVVLNAGDDRAPRGATIGQSLPNWGPVAEAGGRTVAMTNIGVDPDGIAATRRSLEAVFCPATMAVWPEEPGAQLMSTVLHEAGHNLGPSHDYAVDGQADVERFGGATASILEELKAQNAALYLTGWLAERDVLPADGVHPAQVADLAWAMGHIGRGLLDATGAPSTYSQLSAVQVGYLADHGAMTWMPEANAANGEDLGCWEIDSESLPAAVAGLTEEVLQIKATGDADRAAALLGPYTNPTDPRWTTIQERFGREPLASYLYRVVLD